MGRDYTDTTMTRYTCPETGRVLTEGGGYDCPEHPAEFVEEGERCARCREEEDGPQRP